MQVTSFHRDIFCSQYAQPCCRLFFIFFIIFHCSFTIKAQSPFRTTKPATLARRLTKDCANDSEKVVKISYWIAHHIRYDVRTYIRQSPKRRSIRQILRSQKAVCDGYSALFDTLCKLSGIPSSVILGYSKGFMYEYGDAFFTSDHAWNSVRIGHNWYLHDLTWASGDLQIRYNLLLRMGYRIKLRRYPFRIIFRRQFHPEYLFANPSAFILDHYPNNPYWQLLSQPLTISDYENISSDTALFYRRWILDNRALRTCKDCDEIAKLNTHQREFAENTAQLSANPRNTLLFLSTLYEQDASGNPPKDTNAMKQAIVRYDSLFNYIACNRSNIEMDDHSQSIQEKVKDQEFRHYYKSIYKSSEKQYRSSKKMLKADQRALHYYRRYYGKSKAQLQLAILTTPATTVPLPEENDKSRKKLKAANKAHDKAFKKLEKDFDSAAFSLDLADSLWNRFRDSLPPMNRKATEQLAIQKFLMLQRMDFSDVYDTDVNIAADSALGISLRNERHYKSLAPFDKLKCKQTKKYSRHLRDASRDFLKLKKTLKDVARHSGISGHRECVSVNAGIDSLIKEYRGMIREMDEDLEKKIEQNNQNLRQFRAINTSIKKTIRKESAYESGRSVFYKTFFKTRFLNQKKSHQTIEKYFQKKRDSYSRQLQRERQRKH